MFSLCLKKEFSSSHFLPNIKGEEAKEHSHDYVVEVIIRGSRTDENGFLIDLDDLDKRLDDVVSMYEGKLLNQLDDFAGTVPTLEQFAKAFWMRLAPILHSPSLDTLEVRIWESDFAWASFEARVPR